MQTLTKPGDIVAVPLPDGRVAYLRHVSQHSHYGVLMEVKSLIDDGHSLIVDIMATPDLFNPIFVAINPPIRSKRWKKIGFASAEGFQFPRFRVPT
jgi:hypothetical protein